MTEQLTCPGCGSTEVRVASVQLFMANTGKHYCHSVKAHDSDTAADCCKCDWCGQRQDLISVTVKGKQ